MVTITKAGKAENGRQYLELAGLSTDSKGTTLPLNGSLFHELDTKKVYAYDQENEEWIEQVQLSEGDGE